MIPLVDAIRRVLWGNVTLNGAKIPVVKRSYPYDKTPCVTIDDSGSSQVVHRDILNADYLLNENHPQYDKRIIPQQVLRETHQCTINVNIWSDTVDQQEELNNTVMRLFHEAQSDHYQFCDNYNKGQCNYLQDECLGKSTTSLLNNRSVKAQCPNPYEFGYKNIFTTYNLIRASFMVEQPFNLDDKSKDSILYRSVIKVHSGYYTDHIIGGYIDTKVSLEKENTRLL